MEDPSGRSALSYTKEQKPWKSQRQRPEYRTREPPPRTFPKARQTRPVLPAPKIETHTGFPCLSICIMLSAPASLSPRHWPTACLQICQDTKRTLPDAAGKIHAPTYVDSYAHPLFLLILMQCSSFLCEYLDSYFRLPYRQAYARMEATVFPSVIFPV